MIRLILLAALVATGWAGEPLSQWDARLPALHLGHVKLTANSLPDAWQELNTQFAIRGVMVEETALRANASVTLDLPDATLDQALDALLITYPAYVKTQDPISGVIWVHPRARPLATLFADEVDVLETQHALPAGSGLFSRLTEAGYSLHSRGISVQNHNDWPVELPAGRMTVRELCNRALIGEPQKAIFLTLRDNGKTTISLISTLGDMNNQPRPGARLWWSTGWSGEAPAGPKWEGVTTQLASPDPRLRAIARGYIAINSLSMLTEHWHHLPDPIELLWVNLAKSRKTARTATSSYSEVRDVLKRTLTPELLASGPADLMVFAACELTRFTKDPAPIEALAKRADLATADLSGVRDDLHRLARVSVTVRETLARTGVAKQAFPAGVERLGEPPRLVVRPMAKEVSPPAPTPVSAPPVTAKPDRFPWLALGAAGVAALIVAMAAFFFRRRA